MITFNDLIYVLPELLLVFSITLLLLCNLYYNIAMSYRVWRTQIMLFIEVYIFILLSLLLNVGTSRSIFNGILIVTPYTTICKVAIVVCTVIFLALLATYKPDFNLLKFEFLLLINVVILASLMLTAANDFVSLYLSLELQGLCLYVLVAFKQQSLFSAEAGVKYFILGSLASSFVLFGMSLIYGFSGSLNLHHIEISLLTAVTPTLSVCTVGLTFLISGLLFKLTAVPFHTWSPDVYEGIPLVLTTFFTILPKISIFSIFIRLLFSTFFTLYSVWQPLLLTSAILSIVYGTIAALYQKRIKRLLAYSSISHIGYILLPLSTGTLLGVNALCLYIATYFITIAGVFSLFLSWKKATQQHLVYITDLLFIKDVDLSLKIMMMVLLLSLAGMPPLLGFIAKFYVLLVMVSSGYFVAVVISLLSSLVGTFYYLRLIKIINFEHKTSFLNATTYRSFITSPAFLIIIIGSMISPEFLFLKVNQFVLHI